MENKATLYGLKMTMDIRFNREFRENDVILPGEYEMVFAGRKISFDFEEGDGGIGEDPCVMHCEVEKPDFLSFEKFGQLTAEDLRQVSEIVKFYVHIVDECKEDLKVIEVSGITFLLADGSSIPVSEDVVRKYNEELQKNNM